MVIAIIVLSLLVLAEAYVINILLNRILTQAHIRPINGIGEPKPPEPSQPVKAPPVFSMRVHS